MATFHNCPDTLPETLCFPGRIRQLDSLILMSAEQQPFFEKMGVSPDRLHVVPHGVDCQYFTPPVARPSTPFTVLAVGGHRRNFPLLRDVCVRMQFERDVHFRILAPADRAHMFAELPNVTFASGVSDQVLLDSYRMASCLLITLESATANNALLEAMACGLPVVSERLGGIPEYVNEECAILTKPADAHAIVTTLKQLKHNPQQLAAMSSAARTQAESFDWPIIAQRMQELYRALV